MSSSPAPLPSLADAEWLHWPGTVKVFAALTAQGDEVRAVGGAVRDTLLGRNVRDVDLATTARPEKVQQLATAAALKIVPTGIEHGTVTVIADRRPFEVTTLRKDVETFGRHARVVYTSDWLEDACRRDFTINALYADARGKLFDPLGAIDDIVDRKLRFVGDAEARVREDYLRILRFFRFNAELGLGDFDHVSLTACVRERAGLESLSGERVQSELLRLLRAEGAVWSVGKMFEYGLLVPVIGGVPNLARLRNLTEIEAELQLDADAILRLAALALWGVEDATRLCECLRLSNADGSRLEAAADYRTIVAGADDRDILWGLYRRGRAELTSAALMAWATSGMPSGDPRWRGTIARIAEQAIPEFPVSGSDIVTLGVGEGPAIGELLKALELRWKESGFGVGKDELLEVARGLRADAR